MSDKKPNKKKKDLLSGILKVPFKAVAKILEKDLEYELPVKAREGMRISYLYDFSRDGERFLKHFIWVQRAIILMILGLFPFYLSTHVKENFFFPTTTQGRIVPDVPLSEPNIELAGLASWLSGVLTKSMSIGFHDYNRRLRQVTGNYTRDGWQDFTDFLDDERIFRLLNTKQALIVASPLIAPLKEDAGLDTSHSPPRYFWRMKVRYRIEFVNKANLIKTVDAIVTVVRVPKLENGLGISIDGFEVISSKI